MKAMVYTEYGSLDVLHLKDVAKPSPQDHEVLVKVHAASINTLDGWRFKMPPMVVRLMNGGQRKPKITTLGADIAGRVESVGSAVREFHPGNKVFGISAGSVGGFAEFACAPASNLALKPPEISFESAACVPVAALTAMLGLRDVGQIQSGQKVLIQGASGGVGTFAVQIAKTFGAEVTAVCSTHNQVQARAMGADHVIDYTKEDFTRIGQKYDLIVGVNGYHPILHYRRALTPGGAYVLIGGTMPQILQGMFLGPMLSRAGGRKMIFMGIAKPNQKDLVFLGDLLAAGKIRPVIDKHYPLHEVPEALRYLGMGHARGKVVITV